MRRFPKHDQALAYDQRAFVVTAVTSELGLIDDRCGRVLKESTYETLAVAPVNTNSVALYMDFNAPMMDAMLAKYGPRLRSITTRARRSTRSPTTARTRSRNW